MSAPRVVLYRFAEVRAALRCADLAVPGVTVPHDPSHHAVRHSVREQASAASLLELRDPFATQLCLLLEAPRTNLPWCFVANVAVPWAYAVTGQLMRLSPACVHDGAALAANVFESAAHSENGDSTPEALAAANRDPVRFTNPDTLQLAAGRAGHLSFGAGAHHCSGTPIVQALLECLLEALVTSPVTLAPAGPVSWLDGVALATPTRLPVTASR